MTKISIVDALILNAIRFARLLVKILPLRAALRLGTFIGDVAYQGTKRHPVMLRNLRSVFAGEKSPAELKRFARQSFRNLGMAGIELLHAPDMEKSFASKHIRVIHQEKVDDALAQGKGVIFLTGHFGNWEMLSISAGLMGYPMTALAREQKHPRSDAYLNNLRQSQGTQVLFKGMPVREILRSLKAGRIVGILGDQDGGRNGTFVPFFGRMSSYPKGVAAFANRTGAPILPTFIFREGLENHRIEVEGPLTAPPEEWSDEEKEKYILAQFAAILETKIRKDPGQWLWAHRRWKSTPDRFILILSDGKAGHRNQSMALYEAIVHERIREGVDPARTHLKIIEIEFKSNASRKLFKSLNTLFGGRLPAARFWAKKFLTSASYHEIMKTYADIVISAGSDVAGVNLWASRENAARPVVIMDPGLSLRLFHVVIAPRHDRVPRGNNIFETSGALTRTSAEELSREAGVLKSELGLKDGSRVVGFLMGGDTGSIRFKEAIFTKISEDVLKASRECGAVVLATTSRRTPDWADKFLKNTFSSRILCPLLVIANEANRAGVVQGILGISDTIVVSGESISMVSEAVASGKKVIVVEPFEKASFKPKQRQFLDQLERDGCIVRAGSQNLSDLLRTTFSSTGVSTARLAKKDEDVLREAAQKIIR